MSTTTTANSTATNPVLDLVQYQKDQAAKQTSTATNKASAKSGSSSMGKDDFMKLLVTQLRYQDPLAPQDNQQMAAQMAQFSSLESMQNVQKAVEALGTTFTGMSDKQSESSSAITSSSATSMIGKSVRFKQTGITRPAAGSTSDAQVHAKSGSVLLVSDADGNTVRSIPLDGTNKDGTKILDSNGDGKVSWDGNDDKGKIAPAGSYTISIRDSATLTESGYAYQDAAIASVSFDSVGPLLMANGHSFRMKDLVEIHDTPKTAETTPPASTASTTTDTGSATAAAMAMLGKTVRFRDASADLASGESTWTFTAQAGSYGQILNEKGEALKTFSVDLKDSNNDAIMDSSTGIGTYKWDGKTDAGKKSTDGVYYLRIVDPTMTTSAGTTFVEKKVDGLAFDTSGNPRLVSNDQMWTLNDLFTVTN